MSDVNGRIAERLPTLSEALTVSDGRLVLLGDPETHRPTTYEGVDFFEASTDLSDLRGRIVLGVGLTPSTIGAVREQLARAGAAALVIRTDADLDPGRGDMARSTSLATMNYQEGDWAQLANVLRSLLSGWAVGQVAGVRLGDLFGLANALASLAEAAVSVVDSTGQVVGYSTHADQPIDDIRRRTTLLLQEEIPLAQDRDYQEILHASHAMHFPTPDEQYGRVGIAVRAAGELLGSIWVVQIDPGTADRTRLLLDEMAPVVAQHLLRARENANDRDQRNSELLRTVLEDEAHARSAASQLLVDAAKGCTLVCFRVVTFDEVEALRGVHRLLRLVINVASASFAGSHSAIVGPQIATLVPGSVPARVRSFAESVVRTDPALVAGVGTLVQSVPALSRSHREAVATAALLVSDSAATDLDRPARLATFDQVRDRLALRQTADLLDGLDATVGDAASRLLTHDQRHRTELTRTMLTYLNQRGSVREAALALHVHQNTVRQRLEVVRNEVGIDIDAPATRLWLWLRLYVAPAERPQPAPATTG